MFTIYLYHDGKGVFFQYESDIIPQKDDIYVSVDMPDGHSRIVTQRHITPNSNSITIKVDYAYPNLVPKKEEPKEILQTENY